VTDRRRLASDVPDWTAARRCLLRQVRHAIEAGVDYVQIRERDLEAAALADLVSEAVGLSRDGGTRILVNDRVDVALAGGAAGVHLRADSVPAAQVRLIAPPDFVIGRSVHALDEALAVQEHVDYLTAGTIWPSASKDDGAVLLGLTGLARMAAAVSVPVLAIGGVTAGRMRQLSQAGAAGIAAIGFFMRPEGEPGSGCRAVPLDRMVRAARQAFDTPGSGS
jgi:thiamine-phosphate pyrophosphorylase